MAKGNAYEKIRVDPKTGYLVPKKKAKHYTFEKPRPYASYWLRDDISPDEIRAKIKAISTKRSKIMKKAWQKRTREIFLPDTITRNDSDPIADITVLDLKKAINTQTLPPSACSTRHTAPKTIMRPDCEDCRTLRSYARLMKIPLSELRKIDKHEHQAEQSMPIYDTEVDVCRIANTNPSYDQERQVAIKEIWDTAFLHLPPNYLDIIVCLYIEGMTLEETGEKYGYSRQRVQCMEENAINTLRQHFTRVQIDLTFLRHQGGEIPWTKAKERAPQKKMILFRNILMDTSSNQ